MREIYIHYYEELNLKENKIMSSIMSFIVRVIATLITRIVWIVLIPIGLLMQGFDNFSPSDFYRKVQLLFKK